MIFSEKNASEALEHHFCRSQFKCERGCYINTVLIGIPEDNVVAQPRLIRVAPLVSSQIDETVSKSSINTIGRGCAGLQSVPLKPASHTQEPADCEGKKDVIRQRNRHTDTHRQMHRHTDIECVGLGIAPIH